MAQKEQQQKDTKKQKSNSTAGATKTVKSTKRHNYVPMAHRKTRKGKGSSTPGKQKVKRCQATPEHKVLCSRSRSHKWKNYNQLWTHLLMKADQLETYRKAFGRLPGEQDK